MIPCFPILEMKQSDAVLGHRGPFFFSLKLWIDACMSMHTFFLKMKTKITY